MREFKKNNFLDIYWASREVI